MSQKEQLMKAADLLSEEQASAVLMMLYKFLYEEAQDDAFCVALDDAFVDHPDKGELVDFEAACKQLGIQP